MAKKDRVKTAGIIGILTEPVIAGIPVLDTAGLHVEAIVIELVA